MIVPTIGLVVAVVGWIGTAVYLNHRYNNLKIDADTYVYYSYRIVKEHINNGLDDSTDRYVKMLYWNRYSDDFQLIYYRLKDSEVRRGKPAGKV